MMVAIITSYWFGFAVYMAVAVELIGHGIVRHQARKQVDRIPRSSWSPPKRPTFEEKYTNCVNYLYDFRCLGGCGTKTYENHGHCPSCEIISRAECRAIISPIATLIAD